MKKINLLVTALMAMAMGITFNSCGDDDDDPQTSQNEEKSPESGKAKSISEQKAYLDKVANRLMDEVKADDFKSIADLGTYINSTYVNKYEWDEVEKWADDCFKASRSMVGVSETDTETYGPYGDSDYSYMYIYKDIMTNYKALLLASNFCSQFRAQDGRWVRSAANDLEFIFTDQYRQECVLKLTTSGNVKKVHIGELKERHYDSNTLFNENNVDVVYVRNNYYDYTDATIGVPEQIVVTLTQGGKQVVKTTVKIDLSGIAGEEFDLSSSNLSLSALVELNNGYKVNVSQVAYTPNSKVSVSVALTKNDTPLLSASVAADPSGIPQANLSALVSNESEADFDNVSVKNAFAKIDVLGMLQLQGSVQDVNKFASYLEKAQDNKYEESKFKSYMGQANSLATLNAYYDNTSTVQASVKFESFSDKKMTWYNGNWTERTYWYMDPVLQFYDGTSYSLSMEAFFDRDDFKAVIDRFERVVEQYAKLIEEDK
ncbi:hypothetical protein L6475_11070 [Prevotella sp. E9-3]|uniref:hypothetical protein n=1 Tax=Prevotella sp. E9-3 TaxID=2913621 RepID=UPI001EDC41F4|nr:hypothetical protein [Prevotella sp. E9-3]UKK47749.1 hypothetical protein L6475_11070 [Prevotella sp. E9-3]